MSQPSLVVIQLSGGNDYLNTVVPYADGWYYTDRPTISIPADEVLPIDHRLGFHPSLGFLDRQFRAGQAAVILGVGYPQHSRSHFHSMDVWHTARTDGPYQTGWLGQAAYELDPNAVNPVTAVSFGRGLPRALAHHCVPAASIGQLATHGLMTGLPSGALVDSMLDVARQLYAPEAFDDWPAHRLLTLGSAAHEGAERLRAASAQHQCDIGWPTEFPARSRISEALQGVSAVLAADLGTRICYVSHGSFDTHGNEVSNHRRLWEQLMLALELFFADLTQHNRAKDTVVLIFSEFGRRVRENSAGGTDHGAGGVALVLGEAVRGGLYGSVPGLAPQLRDDGDVAVTLDLRQIYHCLLTEVLDVDASAVLPPVSEPLNLVATRVRR